jgi:hypothetical protein
MIPLLLSSVRSGHVSPLRRLCRSALHYCCSGPQSCCFAPTTCRLSLHFCHICQQSCRSVFFVEAQSANLRVWLAFVAVVVRLVLMWKLQFKFLVLLPPLLLQLLVPVLLVTPLPCAWSSLIVLPWRSFTGIDDCNRC